MSYYENIVKQGFFIDENRKDLEGYFFTLFYKNTKYPSPGKFFRGCLKVIGKWEEDILEQRNFTDENLNLMILSEDPQITDEVKEDFKKQLSNLKETDFKVTIDNLPRMKGSYDIGLEEIDLIKDAINKAFKRCKNDIGNPKDQHKKLKPELTINQIALIFVYSKKQITRENGNEIAKQYGHNSGEKLFQRFTYYSSSANRKGKPTPCTPTKLDNKKKLIESIIELLPKDKQAQAEYEVSILKKIYEAEYQ